MSIDFGRATKYFLLMDFFKGFGLGMKYFFAPKATLTSIVDNWNDYYIARVKAALDGTWKSEDTWGGFAANMVNMAPFTNMPADVKALAEKTTKAVTDGSVLPFACPVVDQSGKTVECKGGKGLSDEQILSMNWYVQGIEDKVPQ